MYDNCITALYHHNPPNPLFFISALVMGPKYPIEGEMPWSRW